MANAAFNFIGLLCLISPPFLAFFIWRNFLKSPIQQQKLDWKIVIQWSSIVSISGLWVACLAVVLTIPCDVDRFGWECVAKWRTFSAAVVRLTPLFVLFGAIGRKGTRILSILWVFTINFNCLMIDMMA